VNRLDRFFEISARKSTIAAAATIRRGVKTPAEDIGFHQTTASLFGRDGAETRQNR
jgi:hypothetical protein